MYCAAWVAVRYAHGSALLEAVATALPTLTLTHAYQPMHVANKTFLKKKLSPPPQKKKKTKPPTWGHLCSGGLLL